MKPLQAPAVSLRVGRQSQHPPVVMEPMLHPPQQPAPRTGPAETFGAAVVGSVSFTEREIQVADLLADGLTTPKVGQRLNLAPATVVTYTRHARAKLGVRTTPALIVGLYERQLLPEPPVSLHTLDLDADVLAVIPLLLHGVPGTDIAKRLKRPVRQVHADIQNLFGDVLALNAAHTVRRLRSHGLHYPLITGMGGAA
ncbi:helix-turn-helix transcriptional regulator [Streptomyces sp. NBC_01298]|uniref:response regulator transcription factor n=1 Tax=Streptomyces sp. NBC_01298 TaxID=2903817 RepID=UPI002E12923D|nr:helix-turn-helix transcriptional regulator [Streptomyces sp. NBC_01298]